MSLAAAPAAVAALDARTAAAYADHARAYADDWLAQPVPVDLQALARVHFRAGGATADVGSGSGRDVDWLNRHGYPTIGYEPSAALRAEAVRRFPAWTFVDAALPSLDGIAAERFGNVLCETVVMHMPADLALASAAALVRIVAPGGALILTWRVADSDERDARGRLYTALDADAMMAAVVGAAAGTRVVASRETTSASSGKRIRTVVARKD